MQPVGAFGSGTVGLVTGGASGIGRATIERLVDGGGAAVLFDLPGTDTSWAEGNERIVVCNGDVTSAEDNVTAASLALERFGRLDAAVLNAGIPKSGDLLTLPIEELERVLNVNAKGVVDETTLIQRPV